MVSATTSSKVGKLPYQVEIDITDEDIQKGNRNDTHNPVSRAFKRALIQEGYKVTSVEACSEGICVYLKDGTVCDYFVGQSKSFLETFVNEGRKAIRPEIFTLRRNGVAY